MKQIIIGICMTIAAAQVSAHDFTAILNGQKVYFNISNKALRTAEVTYKGSIADGRVAEVKGELEIPAKVKHNNVVYEVTAIGAKAFSHATDLTGISLPSSVKQIGDFAFEGCTSLAKVVFPAGDVKLGQGTFFKCTSLAALSFGSDWRVLDLTPYRWSDSLRVVTVPAKVGKIQNLKSLPRLQRVEVDANNARFTAMDGVLYNKSGKTLYGVPRSYRSVLKVREGTESVTHGAMMDCTGITAIDLPASLQAFSFRETSRMNGLKELIFRSENPLTTAYANGQACFLLQVANPKVRIVVPKEAENTYKQQLTAVPGEYTESAQAGSIPYRVTVGNLPAAKNIDGLKNLDEYEYTE